MAGFYYFVECNLIIHVEPVQQKAGVWTWEHRIGKRTVFEYAVHELILDPDVIYLGDL